MVAGAYEDHHGPSMIGEHGTTLVDRRERRCDPVQRVSAGALQDGAAVFPQFAKRPMLAARYRYCGAKLGETGEGPRVVPLGAVAR